MISKNMSCDTGHQRKLSALECLYAIKDLRNMRAHDKYLSANDSQILVLKCQMFFELAKAPQVAETFNSKAEEAQLLLALEKMEIDPSMRERLNMK